jgi:hypothetical protein
MDWAESGAAASAAVHSIVSNAGWALRRVAGLHTGKDKEPARGGPQTEARVCHDGSSLADSVVSASRGSGASRRTPRHR